MQVSSRRERREQRAPDEATDRARAGVASNTRLTSALGAVLLVLLAIEGVTIVSIGHLTTAHVVIGMILIPPVLVKMGSTAYRFVHYYRGDAAYREKGAPPALLRLLGPFVVVLTVIVLATGVALLFVPHSLRREMMFLHKVSFVLWFGAMTIHVLGHLSETARSGLLDWSRRSRRAVSGAGLRQWLLATSLAVGVLLGVVVAPAVGRFLSSGGVRH